MGGDDVSEAAGYWWSSSAPEIRVPGVVRLGEEERYELTTIGSLGQSFPAPGSLADVTLFGVCGGTKYSLFRAIMTNQKLHMMELDSSSAAETWMSFVMIRGAHLLPDARFHSASFRCSGLRSLWGRWRTFPEGHPDESYEVGADLAVRGCQVSIVRRRISQFGLGQSSYRDQIVVDVSAKEGLTLSELERNVELPLRALTACVTGRESILTHLSVGEFHDQRDAVPGTWPITAEVNPWTSYETDEQYRASLLKENETFFQEVLRRWMELAENLLNPMVIATPREKRGYLEMETFAAVSAVEQVQRDLTDGRPTTFADLVRTVLADHRETLGLNSHARSKIVNAVKLLEFPLRDRLVHLLDGDSGPFFEWFFRGHISEWAEVSATVRNRLGHGLAMPEGQSENYVLLADVLDASRNVIFLRLLLECGFPEDELMLRLENHRDWNWQVESSAKWPEYLRSLAGGVR